MVDEADSPTPEAQDPADPLSAQAEPAEFPPDPPDEDPADPEMEALAEEVEALAERVDEFDPEGGADFPELDLEPGLDEDDPLLLGGDDAETDDFGDGRQAVRAGADEDEDREGERAVRAPQVLLGKPTGAYSSGATITLNPVDSAGTDNGAANVTVQAGWTLLTGQTIPTSAIIPYQQAANGNLYALGQPIQMISDWQVVDGTFKIQVKKRLDFGWFKSTESDWIDVYTGEECAAP